MKKILALFLIITLVMAAGCTTVSKITTTTVGPDGNTVTVVQELTDEAVFVQAQQAAIKPIVSITAVDDTKPITLSNVAKFEVFGGEGGKIRQYRHPAWDVLSQYGGVAGAILGAGVAGYYANELAATVGAAAGTKITGSFNQSGAQSSLNYAPGNSTGNTTLAPADSHDSTDSHDVSESADE